MAAAERRAAGEELVERGAERVEVRGRAGPLAARLLGRDVVRGPGRARGAQLVGGERDAEVAECRAAVGGEPGVVGLDVAVHDAVGVDVGERVGELLARAEHLGHRQPSLGRRGEPLGQRAAGHEARDDRQPVAVLDRVVHGHDPRVLPQPGG